MPKSRKRLPVGCSHWAFRIVCRSWGFWSRIRLRFSHQTLQKCIQHKLPAIKRYILLVIATLKMLDDIVFHQTFSSSEREGGRELYIRDEYMMLSVSDSLIGSSPSPLHHLSKLWKGWLQKWPSSSPRKVLQFFHIIVSVGNYEKIKKYFFENHLDQVIHFFRGMAAQLEW